MKDYCWVLGGQVRSQVVVNMEYEKTPLQLKKQLGKKFSNLCAVMRDLEARGLISKVASEGKCCLYQLTERGKQIAEMVKRATS